MKKFLSVWNRLSLVKQIIIGLLVGIVLALAFPTQLDGFIPLFGNIFTSALKAVAPVLVFFLVMYAIAQHKTGQKTNMKRILVLYLLGTFLAGTLAVIVSFIFPVSLTLVAGTTDVTPPEGIGSVLKTLVFNIFSNPVDALLNANYIGILAWACIFGITLKAASPATKNLLDDFSNALSTAVKWVISFAPFGIMGLIFNVISESGLKALLSYGRLILVLVGSMAFVALVMNPLIVFFCSRKNPYPLVFKCLVRSFITAFFTRSSAANIPVNMELCEEMELDENTYSVSIPLGATINMAGAAITISVMALSAANTVGVSVDFGTALIMCVLAALSAAGASGVAGGSLLLIPMACSLFGISSDIAMQVVGVGFIVGVIQDSCETGLNSSTDVLFTAAAELRDRRLHPERYSKETNI